MKFNKKVVFTSIIMVTAFSHISVTAKDKHKKTFNSVPVHQCQKLFEETENLIAEAEKQPGTHTQLQNIKSKLKQSKQQILEMELSVQASTCNKGLAKLSRLNLEPKS